MFLPIPTSGQRSDVVFFGLPMAGAGLLFRNVGPETKALGFSNAIDFPALWTCGQDDELVIDNQGFWFCRSCEDQDGERCADTRQANWKCRIAVIPPRKRMRRVHAISFDASMLSEAVEFSATAGHR